MNVVFVAFQTEAGPDVVQSCESTSSSACGFLSLIEWGESEPDGGI